MFPKSSLALVEGVYKNNAVAAFFNGVMAEVVGQYVDERRSGRTRDAGGMNLRLLELGAGTGGSSQGILQKLDEYRHDVEEYRYSDVSKMFILHGEQAYGGGREYLKYAVVDIETGLEAQGVERGVYDVVIAANVLHATRSVRETVRNAKAALKENGVLVLNEITSKSVYAHLTFGLLAGWWAYEDEALRMEGNPGLTVDGWKRVLEEEGFRRVCFPAHEAHGLGQQIIVAESDGIIRQRHAVTTRPPARLTTAARSASSPTPPAMASVATPVSGDAGLLEQVEKWLVEAVGVLLKVKREAVHLDAELSEFGFDSISLTGFANHVNQAQGLDVMPTIFFEHPTLRRFAKYLVEEHGGRLVERFRLKSGVGFVAPASKIVEKSSESEVRAWNARKRRPVQPSARAARSRVEEAEAKESAAEAIAIIGLSGRLPGARDLDGFWENLRAGKDSIVEVPPDRWDWRALYGDEREAGNRSSVKWGAFIEGIDEFDPLFFGISPREARLMDPQHRLMLMYGWKAIEDAGYGPKQLWGSRTGVFVGTSTTGYGELLLTRSGIEGHTATGWVPSVGPHRLSYLLNLHGPSEPIETACSSSLVAIHRAAQAIMSGECELALAGGVSTLISPGVHISFSKAGMLSPDGKCKTFSSRADGFVRGEGVGMVLLKRLSAAERDGDHIYGLIRGSAENHGGRAQSLTAPNPQAQSELIKDAYRRAGISPRSVSYIEAHGTGTALGDPIEINGLKSAFHSLYEEIGEKADVGYCGVGSVKSNIGHLELAAGIAGLIKILLQLKHRTLVPSLHCEEINPYIQLEDSPFYIVRENQPWTTSTDPQGRARPRLAGLSSFGFGGANAHVVVEEYVGRGQESDAKWDGGAPRPAMVVLSARAPERLNEQAAQLRQAIERGALSDSDLTRVAYTLQVGREAMDHRVAMTVESMQELEAKLGEFLEGKGGIEGLYRGDVKADGGTLAVFRGDEELHEALGKWIQRGKWSKVLELWAKGLEIEWEQLYGEEKPRRLSLPTYPFARERYWIETLADWQAPVTGAVTAVLHPLLHRHASDLSELRYRSTFAGDEFFLADFAKAGGHTGRKVLPGVACLEMARAAIEHAFPAWTESTVLELRNIVFEHPIFIVEQTHVGIALQAGDPDRDRVRNLQRRRRAGNRPLPGERGLGPSAGAGDTRSRAARDANTAERAPSSVRATPATWWHRKHVAGLRSASDVDRRRIAGGDWIAQGASESDEPRLPVALDSLLIVSPCNAEMIAWVRYSPGSQPQDPLVRLDIDLCDSHGNICTQMRGVSVQPASRVVAEPAIENAVPVRKEISFVPLTQATPAPVERRKRSAVTLAAPGAPVPAAAVPSTPALQQASAGRPPITLSTVTCGVRLYDDGHGVFSIHVAESVSSRTDTISYLRQALERVQQEPALKVLLLSGLDRGVPRGREACNDAVAREAVSRHRLFSLPDDRRSAGRCHRRRLHGGSAVRLHGVQRRRDLWVHGRADPRVSHGSRNDPAQ